VSEPGTRSTPVEPLARLTRWVARLAGLLAATYVATLIVMFVLRVPHPYDIEWMEGLVVDHIMRVLAGEPLYVEPSIRFTPLIYPPLYYYVAAAATALVGEGLLAPRLVSVLSSLGCFVLLFLFAKREVASAAGEESPASVRRVESVGAGVVAAGLYAAMFELGGGWFDLARIDNLFMMWLLAGCYLLRFSSGGRGLVWAGALFFLAAITKQSAIFVAGPLCLYLLFARGFRSALVFGLAFALPLLSSIAWLHASTGGWHTFYVYALPGQHEIIIPFLEIFFIYDLVQPLPLALVVFAGFIVHSLARLRSRDEAARDRGLFYLLFCAGMMGASAASRIHVGGADNVLLPAYAALALSVAVASTRGANGVGHGWRRFVPLLASGLVVGQLAMLGFDPRLHIPGPADVRAGDLFVEVIESIEGEVFTPDHGYLGARVGKHSYAHYVPLWDVFRGGDSPARRMLLADMARTIHRRELDAILIHKVSRLSVDLATPVERFYREHGPVLPRGFSFAPLGVMPAEAVMLVPR